MDADAEIVEKNRKVSRKKKGVKAQIGPRRKGYYKARSTSETQSSSSDASATSVDDVERVTSVRPSCSRPLTEPHDCSEVEGFSDSTSEYATTDSENIKVEITLPKKKRKRKSFLSYHRKRQPKTVGCLKIDDGVEDEDEDEDDDDDEDEDEIEDKKSDHNDEDSDNNEIYSSGEISIPEDINLSDEDLEYLSKIGVGLGDVAAGCSHAYGSDTNARSEPEPSSAAVSDIVNHGVSDSSPPTATGPMVASAEIPEHGASDPPATSNPDGAANKDSEYVDKDSAATLNPANYVASLIEKLILLLPSEWTVDLVMDHIIRIFTINKSKNPAVQYSIFYDTQKHSVGLFVHGIPLPRSHPIFKSHIVPSLDNLKSVADFMLGLVQKILLSKECQGIENYDENIWQTSKSVFLDYSSSLESPCYRHAQCAVLISNTKNNICSDCRIQITTFEREQKKREEGKLDPSCIPDKYLTKEGMKAKKNKFRMLYREEKQRANRLQKKYDAMKIKLDEVLSDELSSILRSNQHKMTPLQRTFWEDQMKVLALDDKRGMRWHPMVIRLALHLHSLSDASYQLFNEIQVFTLPSSRRLYDYSHFTEATEGCQADLTEQIKEKISKCGEEGHYSYVNLMFDEMHIRSGLVFSRSSGELVGYTKLSGVEEELEKMQSELNGKTFKPRLAKKVLVFLAQGITSDVKDVVAIHSTDDLSASQLYDRTWDVIYHLEQANIKVLCVTCDGASINRKFITMHHSIEKTCGYIYSTKNLAAGDSRPLFFILDPPHLLKTLRNALANSFSHKKSRKLWKNGQFLSWKVIEALYETTKESKFRGHKLTKAHVKLTSFSVMTVSLATQTLSESVAKCIEELAHLEVFSTLDVSELLLFIRLCNRFFDCVNGKDDGEEKKNPDKSPFTDLNDSRFDFLQNDFLGYFEKWKQDILNRPGIYTDTERNRMIVSHQALGALQITVKGIVGAIRYMLNEAKAPSVGARKFNQDPIEQYFSAVRRKQGDNRNPTLKAVLDTRLNLHAQGHLSLPSQKGNTKVQKRKEIEVDSTPLQSRKVPRKSTDNDKSA